VILAIGNIEIRTVAQFNEILKQVPPGRSIALLVRRNDGTVYIPVRLDEK
jgi:serine protease Do